MAWEQRGNRIYYYQKRRVGNQVVSEYVGTGELAYLISQLDLNKREEQKYMRAAARREREQCRQQDAALAEIEAKIHRLVDSVLVAEGYHTHKGQWRLKRGRT